MVVSFKVHELGSIEGPIYKAVLQSNEPQAAGVAQGSFVIYSASAFSGYALGQSVVVTVADTSA